MDGVERVRVRRRAVWGGITVSEITTLRCDVCGREDDYAKVHGYVNWMRLSYWDYSRERERVALDPVLLRRSVDVCSYKCLLEWICEREWISDCEGNDLSVIETMELLYEMGRYRREPDVGRAQQGDV